MIVSKAVSVLVNLSLVLVILCLMFASLAQARPDSHLEVKLDEALASAQTPAVLDLVEQVLSDPHLGLDSLLEIGAKLAEHDYFVQARAVFNRCIHQYPASFEARYNLALSDVALHDFTGAQKTLDGLKQLSKEQQLARDYLQGKIYDAIGQPELALQNLVKAFQGAPEQENYGLDLGLFLLREKLYARALTVFQTTLRYHPASVYVALGLGIVQMFTGVPANVIATSRAILARNPNFQPARLLLVLALHMNGKDRACVEESTSGMNKSDLDAFFRYLHASCMLKTNSHDYSAMQQDLELAARGIPGCAFCYFMLSKVHESMGNDAAAILDLETLTGTVDSQFSQGWYRLASLYKRAGRSADAAKALEKVREIKTRKTDNEIEYLRGVATLTLGGATDQK